jgi:hypothetical protein
MTKIIKADFEDISQIAPLLNAYRIFYGQTSDVAAATTFLKKEFLKANPLSF